LAVDATASQFDLAVLGADDPLGESFLAALEESDLPVGRIYPLVLDEPESVVAFRGEEWPCLAAQGFDFGHAQALVVTSPHAAARHMLSQVRDARPAMPVLSPDDVTPAPALAVTRVLKVLDALGSLRQAEAFVSLPVALAGKLGVDELANQSRRLFNMESPDPEVFPLHIAFNIIPQLDDASQRYGPAVLAAAVRKGLPLQDLGFTVAWASLFFGATTALHVRLERPAALDELRLALDRHDGICLMESELPAGNPTPATDSAGSVDIFLGQIRTEGVNVRLWLVYDPLRLESEQMISAVENWIDKPLNSVLT